MGKAYNTGFVFEGELVADYPNCLYGVPSEVTIVAGKDCTLMVIEGQSIQRMYEEDPHLMNIGKRIGEGLFLQTYTRFLSFFLKAPMHDYTKGEEPVNHLFQQYTMLKNAIREMGGYEADEEID